MIIWAAFVFFINSRSVAFQYHNHGSFSHQLSMIQVIMLDSRSGIMVAVRWIFCQALVYTS